MTQQSFVDQLIRMGRLLEIRGRGAALDRRTLLALEGVSHPLAKELARVIRRMREPLTTPELELVQKIEAVRDRFSRREGPLVDGSLSAPGLFDEGVTIKRANSVSKPKKAALLLYHLIRTLKPRNVIELGTNVGISSAYLAAGLHINGQGGKLVTLEASPYRIRLAKELHESAGLSDIRYVQGLFTDTLKSTLDEIGPVDLAFIDGHHQYQPTLDYFGIVHQQAMPGAIFVFDDIRWSDGMTQAWKEFQQDKRIALSVDLYSMGVCVGATSGSMAHYASPPIYAALL